jgi:tRNA dimethylallyltransferase
MDQIPAIDPAIRSQIQEDVSLKGMDWLQAQVQAKDPAYWAQADKGEQQNTQRLSRALEVVIGTGLSILSFQLQSKKTRSFDIKKIGLELPRQQLYVRINQRVVQMVELGLEEEVSALHPQFHLNALQTVGYQEWLPYFEGHQTKEAVVQAIQQNTRHYAKRQMTWFKKDPEIQWNQASK